MAHDDNWQWFAPRQNQAEVDLSPYRTSDGRLIDPVNRAVAHRITARESMSLGLLPFSQYGNDLLVATTWPMHPDADLCLRRLAAHATVHLLRVSEVGLRRAQSRVFGAVNKGEEERLGHILLKQGVATHAQVAEALLRQRVSGGRLGDLLVSTNAITYFELAKALARQADLPVVDLLAQLHPDATPDEPRPVMDLGLFDLLPESFWRGHEVVPVRREKGQLLVAMVDPFDHAAINHIAHTLGEDVRPMLTGRRDIVAALDARYGVAYARESQLRLLERRPDQSAKQLLTRGQMWTGIGLAGAVVAGLALRASTTLVVLSAVFELFYLLATIYRLVFMVRPAGTSLAVPVSPADLNQLDVHNLPTYTVLVPAYKEAAVLPTLARALTELDYPKDKLDVKLLLEEDDTETIQVARKLGLPSYIEIVCVPPGGPRTKPKACNYGLQRSRGDLLVIYDAEDIPEPDQLKKAVAAFKKVPDDVVALQCPVSFFNRDQNAMTALFTAEYAAWFDLLLPSLQAARLPLPLGGNSTHFRIDFLRKVDAWDPFNVAEDADLGIRLSRDGYHVGVIDSTTYEEATSEITNWVRQRSRWLKGYMQTWLVHMRHPVQLWRQLGTRGMLAFQMIVAGTTLLALLNPVYWLLTSLWFVTKATFIQSLFPAWIFYLAMGNFFFGNFIFTYMNLVAVAKRGEWGLVRYGLVSPIYWNLQSLGAWKAIMQLVSGQAQYWEKTEHGMAATAPGQPSDEGPSSQEVAIG